MTMTILGWYTLIVLIMSLTLTINSSLDKESMTTVVVGVMIYAPMIIYVGRVLWMQ